MLITATIMGMLAVIFGAFGAHALQDRLDEHSLSIWNKSVQYQFYHVLAMLAAILIAEKTESKWAVMSANRFFVGILLFSGSLYLLALRPIIGMNMSWLGPVTPVGGVFFILGWVCLLMVALRTEKK